MPERDNIWISCGHRTTYFQYISNTYRQRSKLLLGKLGSELAVFQLFVAASHAHVITYCISQCTQGILSIFHWDMKALKAYHCASSLVEDTAGQYCHTVHWHSVNALLQTYSSLLCSIQLIREKLTVKMGQLIGFKSLCVSIPQDGNCRLGIYIPFLGGMGGEGRSWSKRRRTCCRRTSMENIPSWFSKASSQ